MFDNGPIDSYPVAAALGGSKAGWMLRDLGGEGAQRGLGRGQLSGRCRIDAEHDSGFFQDWLLSCGETPTVLKQELIRQGLGPAEGW